ncbi:MAG TPA: FAD-binding oxidoreductase [Acidimicrobiales bacterium]|nr:FAD-binding oxidoreductase [Acidimicrobiales bacterium]
MDEEAPAANDSVDGVPARRTVRPESTEALAALLTEGAAAGEAVVFVTGRSKLDWGRPPRQLDAVVDLSAMERVIEHAAGDLVVRTSASVRLAELNAELARAGQRLAIDEVVPGTSIGGLIATGLSGPLRHAFGSVRDLLLGITVVRADGRVARSGGRVVKNVAGYDLGKLFTGSFGTLGAITEAWFRLHPLPAARRYLSASWSEAESAAATVRRVATSTAAPAAVELGRDGRGPYAVTVLLEGSEASVAARADQLEALTGARFAAGAVPPEGFGSLPGDSTLKLTFAPGTLGPLLDHLDSSLAGLGGPGEGLVLRGAAGVGVLFLGAGPEVDLAPVLRAAREAATAAGGGAIVLRAPAGRRAGLDLYGPLPAPALQRAVKASFDPGDRLAPGRFVAA